MIRLLPIFPAIPGIFDDFFVFLPVIFIATEN